MSRAELKQVTAPINDDKDLIAGRYRTQARIGSGRLGDIFEAIANGSEELDVDESDVEMNVAIQIVPESIVRNNRLFNKINLGYTRFQSYDHANLVKYLRFGRYGKRGYLAMERLDGVSLREALDKARTLPIEDTKAVVRSIGAALELLHSQELIHGNLKAENVFITDDLEVRLLDVLPIDPDESIVSGGKASDPFSRRTAKDDVFDLASLAYEMLTGKHPFDFRSQAEARLAGAEAERIAFLTNNQWNALSAALTFDREQQTTAVEDFMRDFGIQGTEQLRSNVQQLASHESVEYPAVRETPRVARPVGPAESTTSTNSVTASESISADDYAPLATSPFRKKAGTRRAKLLSVLLVALGAWSFFGESHDQIERLARYLDDYLMPTLVPQAVEPVIAPLSNPVEPAVPEAAVPVEQPTTTEPAIGLDENLSSPAVLRPDPDLAAAEDATDVVPVEAAEDEAEAVTMQPETGFTQSIVAVRERDGAARIELVHAGNSTLPLIWWTREHSALADTDFIAVEQQAVADVLTEGSSVLHVPLVNDSLPEPAESFFVILGVHDPLQGQIERIASVRVDIVDDD